MRGWIRLQLSAPVEGRSDSTKELALFTIRALDSMLLTAGLGDRPVHRKA